MEEKILVQEYWDKNVSNWKIASAPVGSEIFFRETERYRFEKLNYLPQRVDFNGFFGKRLLDVGCGLGNDLSRFASGGANCVGIDISPTAIKLAKQNFTHRKLSAEFLQMDGEKMSFEDNSFDVIYCHTVLHFTPNPEAMIKEIHRVLKPGGQAIMMTINRHSWLYLLHRLTKLKMDYMDAPVFNKYTYREFEKMLSPFSRVNLTTERFPVRTEVHNGIKAMIYNTFFVDAYNSLPQKIIGHTGYHLLAFAHKD
jgi:2-polyprenyl-3-methyl-5-hydroxy-6-metoxy-1,4-benzoquinol methylase